MATISAEISQAYQNVTSCDVTIYLVSEQLRHDRKKRRKHIISSIFYATELLMHNKTQT